MGNSIYRFLCGLCAPSPAEHGLHGAHPAVAALGRDILSFGANSQVSCQLRISIDAVVRALCWIWCYHSG